jgi:hypothetical protein
VPAPALRVALVTWPTAFRVDLDSEYPAASNAPRSAIHATKPRSAIHRTPVAPVPVPGA